MWMKFWIVDSEGCTVISCDFEQVNGKSLGETRCFYSFCSEDEINPFHGSSSEQKIKTILRQCLLVNFVDLQ
jgi:hypothetical protein